MADNSESKDEAKAVAGAEKAYAAAAGTTGAAQAGPAKIDTSAAGKPAPAVPAAQEAKAESAVKPLARPAAKASAAEIPAADALAVKASRPAAKISKAAGSKVTKGRVTAARKPAKAATAAAKIAAKPVDPARKPARKVAAKAPALAPVTKTGKAPASTVKAPVTKAKVPAATPAVAPRVRPVAAAKPVAVPLGGGRGIETGPTDPLASVMTLISGFLDTSTAKDSKMDMSANFGGFQEAMTDAQAKAKAAFEKGSSMLGEVGDFTKGNVEAVIESGKILAGGMQEMGSSMVAEGRTAFETMTADVKELAAAKSPTDYFKLQSEMMKKSLDSAVAYGSKNSETMLKLMSDAMAPLSGRMSLAMEKARSAA